MTGAGIHVRELGHVVIKARDLGRSESFYSGLLGIPISSRISEPVRMTFFTLRHDHDLAIIEVEPDSPEADPQATGLDHIAFDVGDSVEQLEGVRHELARAGIVIRAARNHGPGNSLFVADPDGHEIELYVDTNPSVARSFGPSTMSGAGTPTNTSSR